MTTQKVITNMENLRTNMKTNRKTMLLALLAAFSLTLAGSGADLPLSWRGQVGSTYEAWQFNSGSNPSLVDVATAVGVPANLSTDVAGIVLGQFSSGWVGQLTGSWDLGRQGTITVPVLAGCNYVSLQVEQMIDGAIYGTLASVSLPGAALIESRAQEVGGDGFAGWTISQTIWRVQAGATAGPAVITGAYDGSVVNRVVLETLTGEPPQPSGVQLSIRRLSATQVEVSWPTVAGAVLQSNGSLTDAHGWTPVGITPQVIGDRSVVVLELADSMRFLRVQQP